VNQLSPDAPASDLVEYLVCGEILALALEWDACEKGSRIEQVNFFLQKMDYNVLVTAG
jgi:hypothetical protein